MSKNIIKSRIIISKIKKNKRLVRKIRRILSKIPKVYRPSFEAVVFGIVGSKPKRITGIELRPIIKKLVNRKKRNRKVYK